MSWTPRGTGIDKSTQATETIDYAHHEIHSGDHYYVEGHATMSSDGVLKVALVTPNTAKWSHLSWLISSNGILTAEFYEDAEGVSGGSDVAIRNNNRNSANTSGITLTTGVTTTGDGTLISQAKWGGTGFKSVTGGSGSRTDELILKQDTTYLRVFTSATADQIVSFKAMWYEHTAKS